MQKKKSFENTSKTGPITETCGTPEMKSPGVPDTNLIGLGRMKSRSWSYLVVLNLELLDWESATHH